MTEANPPALPGYARGYENWPARIGRTVGDSQRAWPRPKRAPEARPTSW